MALLMTLLLLPREALLNKLEMGGLFPSEFGVKAAECLASGERGSPSFGIPLLISGGGASRSSLLRGE